MLISHRAVVQSLDQARQDFCNAAAGSGKRLVITSGTAMLGDSGEDLLVEDTGSTAKHPRGESESVALKVEHMMRLQI